MSKNISRYSKLALVCSAIFLLATIFVPIWKIELNAPQYPEGLVLKIYASKLGGQVDIINGLNHYIGMETLHAENFIEFTILQYLIGGFSLLFIVSALFGTRKSLYFSFISFAIFGIIAMADFWRWEYNYGHNLDPNAAIIVPGMAYQPPLIGYKQLLNFGAYSIPDVGGWLFIGAAILLLIAILKEANTFKHFKQRKTAKTSLGLILFTIFHSSCINSKPQPIHVNIDHCEFCRMTIADIKFSTELVTKKGRVYKFDDINCMINYLKDNSTDTIQSVYATQYHENSGLIDATEAFYVTHSSLKSPMGGNTIAFYSKANANRYATNLNTKTMNYSEICKMVP